MRVNRWITSTAVLAVLVGCQPDTPVVPDVGSPEMAKIPGAPQGGQLFRAELTGANEVTAGGVPNQGDPDGIGTALVTLNHGQGQVCFSLEYENIATPTAAHIHVAPATTTGPVVVGFFNPPFGLTWSDTGCRTADGELIKQIRDNPAGYYVNIHNAEYPAGAIRGQLAK